MSNPTPPSPPAPQPRTVPAFGAITGGGAVALGALLLVVLTDKPAAILPWALCVLGLSAFAPVIPAVPRLLQLGIMTLICVALVAGSIVVFVNPKLLTYPKVRIIDKSHPISAKVKKNIKLGPIAEPIPFCNQFLGTGTIPAGYQLWIFDKGAEDPNTKYYIDTQAVQDGNTWVAKQIQIGDGAGDTGHRTTILAVLLPVHLVRWMLSISRIENGIPSPTLPPGAVVADQTVVTRSSNKKPCRF